jgi:hypothetical protein
MTRRREHGFRIEKEQNKKLMYFIQNKQPRNEINFILKNKRNKKKNFKKKKKKATKYLDIDSNLHLQIVHLTLELIS